MIFRDSFSVLKAVLFKYVVQTNRIAIRFCLLARGQLPIVIQNHIKVLKTRHQQIKLLIILYMQ